MVSRSFSVDGTSLRELERRFSKRAREVAIFLVYDRPDRINERPELARSFFAERCVSDDQLARMIEVYRSVGAYVELFDRASRKASLRWERGRSIARGVQAGPEVVDPGGGGCVRTDLCELERIRVRHWPAQVPLRHTAALNGYSLSQNVAFPARPDLGG